MCVADSLAEEGALSMLPQWSCQEERSQVLGKVLHRGLSLFVDSKRHLGSWLLVSGCCQMRAVGCRAYREERVCAFSRQSEGSLKIGSHLATLLLLHLFNPGIEASTHSRTAPARAIAAIKAAHV